MSKKTIRLIKASDILMIDQNPNKDRYEVFVKVRDIAEPVKILDITDFAESETAEVLETAVVLCSKCIVGAARCHAEHPFFMIKDSEDYIRYAKDYIDNGGFYRDRSGGGQEGWNSRGVDMRRQNQYYTPRNYYQNY